MSAQPAEIPDDDPGWARYHQISDEWADELGRNVAYLKAACADAVPVAPEIQAILDSWREGGGDLPWVDAAPL